MKKILIAISAIAALLMTSCTKDFVTVKHNSSEPQSEYYINESRMYESLVAAYDPLQWCDYFYQYNPLNLISDIMGDDMYCGGSNDGDQPILVKMHYYTSTATECPNQLWTILYSGVNRCCHVLENVDDVPGMSDESKTLYKAEATVLKALYYSLLWKFWGNIPYYDVNLLAPYTAEQLDHDAVYEQIVSHLEEVFSWNILPMKADAGKEGRVTKAMAYMLYAEVVMYQNDESRYQTALNYMKEIINSGKYSLVSDFASIWKESGEWCSESIWEINYISDGGVRDWGAPIATGGTVMPVLIGVPLAHNGYDEGWGFGPIPEATYKIFAEDDTRRDASIYNHNAWLAANPDVSFSPRWQSEGYYLEKYIAKTNDNHGYIAANTMNYCNNYRYYRYSETLLNAAELAVLLKQDGSLWLKEVRDRANCKDTGSDQVAIIAERRKEFVGEGKRYWDLVRSGLATTTLKAANHKYRSTDWSENKKYLPIPQSEIDKDPNLVQNNY